MFNTILDRNVNQINHTYVKEFASTDNYYKLLKIKNNRQTTD